MSLKKTISRVAIVALGAALSTSASHVALADDSSATSGWTGPYVGVSAGVEESNNQWTSTSLGLNNFAGVAASSASQGLDGLHARVGGYAGWDFPVGPNLILGAEADIAGLFSSRTTITGIPGVTYNFPSMGITGVTSIDTVSAKQNFDASVRARLGYALDSHKLVYATGGVAFQGSDFKVNCPTSANTSSFCGAPESQTFTKTMVGWTLGVGAEAKVADHWSVSLEYRYADYGSRTFNFFTGNNSGVDSVSARVGSASHIITAGVTYRFNDR